MPMARKAVSLEDVRAVMGDEAEARVEEACDAAGSGDFARLDLALERLWTADTSPVAGAARRDGAFPAPGPGRAKRWTRGETVDAAMKQLRPPVHFSARPVLQGPGQALERSDRLADALDMLLEAEALSRTTAVPAEAVCGRALMNIAALAQGRELLMLKVRIIPCLDVKDGRVVKGVNFEQSARCRRSGRAGDDL